MTDLAEKVTFLSNPATYRDGVEHVDVQETHMSWLFLTAGRVYKLKKPVRYPFLDFSTLEKRRFFCNEELRLNRRLADGTYRAVVPLCRDRAGGLTLGGNGEVVDWLVEMVRLPAADMLDARLAEGRVTRRDIEKIGDMLGRFYAGCPPETADGGTYLQNLVREQAKNRAVLEQPEFGLAARAAGALDAVDKALARLRPEIEARIRRGRIVEGHGDLRPEHVCLTDPPQVIDCLEFNRDLRIVDPYDEVTYLGLECAMRGAPWIGPLLVGRLEEAIGDRPSAPLLALYGGFRALLRARLCIAHLLEHDGRPREKWKPLTIGYLAQADSGCLSLPSPADP